MRKTARPVVWEGAGAQSPAPDPIDGLAFQARLPGPFGGIEMSETPGRVRRTRARVLRTRSSSAGSDVPGLSHISAGSNRCGSGGPAVRRLATSAFRFRFVTVSAMAERT